VKGSVALVTGGTQGLGAAIAAAFRGAGATVVVNSRHAKGPGTVRGDVSKDADRIVREVVKRHGRLDVLVNNAGVADPKAWTGDLEKVTLETWERILRTDAWGTFACSRAAVRAMKRGGKIINVASIPALVGDRDGLVYTMAKAAILGLTKSLAISLAPRIQVNAMAFGSMETGWAEWLTPRQRRAYRKWIPLGRFGRPEEAGELALFLARSDWVTGQTYVLDGGEARA
jgi:3-oxoacyl-[acyl-carrier protein] reductase